VFFVVLAGHRGVPRVARALERLAEGRTVRVLGSYRKADEA
jgi:prephenate dehydratase